MIDSKRIFDLIVATGALILLSPLLLFIALVLKISSKGPVFFCQKRVGQYEKQFYIYKFRTMVVNAEMQGLKLTVGKDTRITPLGHLLRKTKIDELPQLLNVVCGTMSLVGPRPEVPEFICYYPDDIRAIVFKVRPGITDWASIKMIDENKILAGSNNPQQLYIEKILPEKLSYAVSYVHQHNLLLDLRLLGLTIVKIITR